MAAGQLRNRIHKRRMQSLGASQLAAVAAAKSSLEIKRQLCCAPAIVEDRTQRVINISRVCLRAEQSFRFFRCSHMLQPVYASVCWFGPFTLPVSLGGSLRCSFLFIKYKPQSCVPIQSKNDPLLYILSVSFHYITLQHPVFVFIGSMNI